MQDEHIKEKEPQKLPIVDQPSCPDDCIHGGGCSFKIYGKCVEYESPPKPWPKTSKFYIGERVSKNVRE